MKRINVVAYSLEMDPSDLSEYRYKSTRTSRSIYAVGDNYYAQGKTKPADAVGGEWEKHLDQYWAEKAGTILWVCSAV
tara:strand:- start:452 stop:685 length:234 start_codon:yes stop_codon:yes gene_type:complete